MQLWYLAVLYCAGSIIEPLWIDSLGPTINKHPEIFPLLRTYYQQDLRYVYANGDRDGPNLWQSICYNVDARIIRKYRSTQP